MSDARKPSASAKTPEKPKRPPTWRELTDEQRWERIYADRKKKADQTIRSVPYAVSLALPSYVMQATVAELGDKGEAYLRHDAHQAIVGSLALVASRLIKKERKTMAIKLERLHGVVRRSGFFLDGREFLYATACATVKLADEWRYPPDAPATLAALVLKEDAEFGDNNDWGLSEKHAVAATGWVYDSLTATELYPALV